MEKIGLIGGVSWVSTAEYYKRLNIIAQRRGGEHASADIVLVSLNFEEILKFQRAGDDVAEYEILLRAGKAIERAGAKKLLICSNTTSNTCDRLQDRLDLKIVNIIDATMHRIINSGFDRVGLLGTRYVMERDFYKSRLEAAGIVVVVPTEQERITIHNIIYSELCNNIFSSVSRDIFIEIIKRWTSEEVDAVILGCTEIPLLMHSMPYQNEITIIDSIDAHLEAALGSLDGFSENTESRA